MSCQVYVIAACFEITAKVGITSSPKARLAAIQTGSRLPVEYAYLSAPMTRAQARAVEAEVHSRLADVREAGEWFAINPFTAKRLVEAVTNEVAA